MVKIMNMFENPCIDASLVGNVLTFKYDWHLGYSSFMIKEKCTELLFTIILLTI